MVVGLKDLGESVTVEVRASHEALISLLRSQKETIIRHLEVKDVRTNILIDPNAAGTQERRDGKESKRRLVQAVSQNEGAFGTFLETFA